MTSKDWIVQWFSQQSSIPWTEIEQTTDQNYFDLGYIDSFGFISFLSDLEDQLDFSFDNAQFEDRRFVTIDGLCQIIQEHEDG
ncbi:MAG: acyl carrier protein [Peptococcaceae bacterium]|nr:acyl carrier protein [Peptococcaceae bacterium]